MGERGGTSSGGRARRAGRVGGAVRADGAVRLEDMRLLAKVAEAQSFTGAARALGVPKQTLSRRIGELERALGTRLIYRTTRRLRFSDVGAAYAERCAEIVRAADEANRAVTDADPEPRGTLRVTADPVFGDAFVGDLVVAYARRWPAVRVDVVLTHRRVDLIEEGFDVAFRVGNVDDASLSGARLGAARVRYCAAPDYVARRGAPKRPEQLDAHDCVVVAHDASPQRWPVRVGRALRLVPVRAAFATNSFAMARAATLAGRGVALFPEFACADDLKRGRLVPVLGRPVDVGAIRLLHAARRFLPARVRAFVDLAKARFPPVG